MNTLLEALLARTGREVSIRLPDGDYLIGDVVAVDDDHLTFDRKSGARLLVNVQHIVTVTIPEG